MQIPRAPFGLLLLLLLSGCLTASPDDHDHHGPNSFPASQVVAFFEPEMANTASLVIDQDTLLVYGEVFPGGGKVERSAQLVSLRSKRVTRLPATEFPGTTMADSMTLLRLDSNRVLVVDVRLLEPSQSYIYQVQSRTFRTLVTPNLAGRHVHPLPGGRVLVSSGPRLSAVFDNATESWRELPVQEGSSIDGTSTVLPDGKVLITGLAGNSYDDPAAAWLFLPDQERFEAVAAPSEQRELAASSVLPDGRVIVFGGRDGVADAAGVGDPVLFSSTAIFDPISKVWSAGPVLPEARALGTALRDGDDVLLVGGLRAACGGDVDCGFSEVLRLRPGASSFEQATPLNHSESAPSLVLLDRQPGVFVSGVGVFLYPFQR